jgi:hypothetical protein
MARRSGDKWYVAGVTSDATPMKYLSGKLKVGKNPVLKLDSFFDKGTKPAVFTDSDAIVIVGDAK